MSVEPLTPLALKIDYYQQLLGFGLTAVRPAAMFLILPAFSPQTIPPMVRNSVFLALGFAAIAVNPTGGPPTGLVPNAAFFLKEIFIGLSIGLFFSIFLYALETAGQLIDNITGRSYANIVDPLGGHQSSITGAFFARLGNFIFMFSGGFMLMVGVLMESYGIWPLSAPFPNLNMVGMSLIEGEYQRLMATAVAIAAPAMCLLFAVDMALGLVNRYAQQLNVFSLSMSIKAWLSTLAIIATLSLTANALIQDMAERAGVAIEFLKNLTG